MVAIFWLTWNLLAMMSTFKSAFSESFPSTQCNLMLLLLTITPCFWMQADRQTWIQKGFNNQLGLTFSTGVVFQPLGTVKSSPHYLSFPSLDQLSIQTTFHRFLSLRTIFVTPPFPSYTLTTLLVVFKPFTYFHPQPSRGLRSSPAQMSTGHLEYFGSRRHRHASCTLLIGYSPHDSELQNSKPFVILHGTERSVRIDGTFCRKRRSKCNSTLCFVIIL